MQALITIAVALDDVGPAGVLSDEALRREASKLAEGIADASEGMIVRTVLATDAFVDALMRAQ